MSDRIYVMASKPGIIKAEIVVDFFKENKHQRLLPLKLLKIKEDIIGIIND